MTLNMDRLRGTRELLLATLFCEEVPELVYGESAISDGIFIGLRFELSREVGSEFLVRLQQEGMNQALGNFRRHITGIQHGYLETPQARKEREDALELRNALRIVAKHLNAGSHP